MDTIDRAAEYEEMERLAFIEKTSAGWGEHREPRRRPPKKPTGKPAMRTINTLIVHCSATRPTADVGAADITRWHQKQGWRTIGYHYVIRRDGTLENGRPVEEVGAHTKGYNAQSLGICLVGGLDNDGKAAPIFTVAQMATLKTLITDLRNRYKIRTVLGHRDFSPDLDGDGIVEPHEWVKNCPCFDVDTWLRTGQIRDQGKLYPPADA